ncbi:hypothetical protein GBAR_LOCUS18364 [Geodia barretti]|uniref:Uncharacterized protein n=1 Tax=Geodia barretti TaxID=519541 RepID=A0AA35SMD6_GEOBA|nr:hypothetical protein GBAR_LOCUS18364 [Geodia barretti]
MSFVAVFTLIGGFSLTVIPGLVFPNVAWLLDIMPVSPSPYRDLGGSVCHPGAGGLLCLLQLYQAAHGGDLWEFQRGVTAYRRSFPETMKELMGEHW